MFHRRFTMTEITETQESKFDELKDFSKEEYSKRLGGIDDATETREEPLETKVDEHTAVRTTEYYLNLRRNAVKKMKQNQQKIKAKPLKIDLGVPDKDLKPLVAWLHETHLHQYVNGIEDVNHFLSRVNKGVMIDDPVIRDLAETKSIHFQCLDDWELGEFGYSVAEMEVKTPKQTDEEYAAEAVEDMKEAKTIGEIHTQIQKTFVLDDKVRFVHLKRKILPAPEPKIYETLREFNDAFLETTNANFFKVRYDDMKKLRVGFICYRGDGATLHTIKFRSIRPLFDQKTGSWKIPDFQG